MAIWYCNYATGNDSTGTGTSGNPYKTIAKAISVGSGGDVFAIQNAATQLVSAAVTPPAGTASNPTIIVGCTTTVGDGGIATIQATASMSAVLLLSNDLNWADSLVLDANSLASRSVESDGNYNLITNCKFIGWTATASVSTAIATFRKCWCTGGGGSGSGGFQIGGHTIYELCVADTCNSQPGFYANQPGQIIRCIARNCTGAAGHGFQLEHRVSVIQCSVYNNAGDGIHLDGGNTPSGSTLWGNILAKNGGYGINSATNTATNFDGDYNAFWSNTSGLRTGIPAGAHDVTLTGDPFSNGSGSISSLSDAWTNFLLNSTAGAGAACRAAGYPPYLDLGAVQHQDAGGGGTTVIVVDDD